jgi:hypothetical protein
MKWIYKNTHRNDIINSIVTKAIKIEEEDIIFPPRANSSMVV